jgi:glucose/mannose-6-phosphate isomerase
LLVDCLGDVITVPLLICQDYALPTWINAYTLVIAVSYSGNTEETLEAMTQAHQAGCHIVGISS